MTKHVKLICQDAMKEVCGENQFAWIWFQQMLEVSLLWDHLVDRDTANVDTKQLGVVMKFLLVDWHVNPFFQQNKSALIPVMVNSISAWESSNDPNPVPKIKAYDVASEVISTIAFLVGGQAWVDEKMPKLRRLIWQACQVDDKEDDGKR